MHPSPLAFFFPYWGLFTRSGSAPERVDARPHQTARNVAHRAEGAVAASALAGQFQRALEIDPMQAAAITRLWRQAPR